jgi:hypothetical protein
MCRWAIWHAQSASLAFNTRLHSEMVFRASLNHRTKITKAKSKPDVDDRAKRRICFLEFIVFSSYYGIVSRVNNIR